MWWIAGFMPRRPLCRFLLYSLLNATTISPAGQLAVPWTKSKLIKKDHYTMCPAPLEGARVMLWIGIKASAALVTYMHRAREQEGVGWGDDNPGWGWLPAALPPPSVLAGRSSFRGPAHPSGRSKGQTWDCSGWARLISQNPSFPLPYLPSKGICWLKGDFCAEKNYSEVTLVLKLIFDFTKSKPKEIFCKLENSTCKVYPYS